MTSTFKMALSAATLVAGLAATPASAQFAAGAGGGGGGVVIQGGGGAALGGGGGFGSGHAPMAPAAPMAAPQFRAAPAVVPQAHVPQLAPGGGFAAPRGRNPVGTPMVQGSPWTGGGVTHAPRQPRPWPGAGGVTRPHDTAQSMYHGGRRHHGRGHWRGGVWYPYYLGGYDTYSAYDYDDDYCVLRKVRVYTQYGWRRVWRRVCT